MRLLTATLSFVAAATLLPTNADAFCGFYVAGGGAEMFNDATQVVLMRQGTRTVLSMQNHYKGPLADFAMVIPVPVVLQEGDVKTLPNDVFAKVEAMGAPRLVEYWERDPCYVDPPYDRTKSSVDPRQYSPVPSPAGGAANLGVKVEAQFQVGEYQIVILSAKDSTGLETWLKQEKYSIPAGAAELLKPYVASGMKFFVAKVDPKKVRFQNDSAMLSPLRFHYDSEHFSLPIRLGLANSAGMQDLIVNILAPAQRYEVANYKNVTIPTNFDVKPSVRERFGEFYAALYDQTVEKNPGAVVTEYAWQAMGCDPCPGPMIDMKDLLTLGADVIGGANTADSSAPMGNMVLTRMHARYGKDIKDDLVFKTATPIVGGREHLQSNGQLEERSAPDSHNNFQGRYAIRHAWEGPITCANPRRGVWGGPWQSIRDQIADRGPKAATNLAFAPRGKLALPTVVAADIPELAIKAEAPALAPRAGSDSGPPRPDPAVTAGAGAQAKKKGCGCQSTDSTTGAAAVLIGFAAFPGLIRRRRTK